MPSSSSARSSGCPTSHAAGRAEKRDVKGLDRKACRGELKNLTGIDSPYESPEHPEIYVDTTKAKAEESAALIIEHLRRQGRLGTV